jgi:hypothetical protein
MGWPAAAAGVRARRGTTWTRLTLVPQQRTVLVKARRVELDESAVVAYGAPYPSGYRLQTQNLGPTESLDTPIVNNAAYPSSRVTANVTGQVYFARLMRR